MKRLLMITIFRMWAAGSVCFFAAWGRIGITDAPINLIAGLIAIMVLCDIIIIKPVIRLATGKNVFGEEKKGIMFVFSLPLHIIGVSVIMLIIVFTYYLLNILFIRIFTLDENSVPVPLEPFLFGFLYGLYYLLYEIIYKLILVKIFPTKFKENT